MPRRFALALIAVVLIQFCAFYAWQRYEHNKDLDEVVTFTTATNRTAVTDLEELLNYQVMAYEELMMDDSKARFTPLLRFVTDHHVGYEAFASNDDKHKFHKNAVMFIKSVSADYQRTLLREYENVDLRKDDALVKGAAMEKLTADAVTKLKNIPHRIDADLRDGMIRLITLNYLKEALMDVMAVCGGKATIFDAFFPVFNADRCAYQAGDTLNARVSVGSYSSALDPENVVLTVDGKEYPIGPDGTAIFQTTERKRGQHTLKTRVVVTNPFTGEVKTGAGSFTYQVY